MMAKIGPVPLLLAPAIAFGLFWCINRFIAYHTWTEEEIAADFADVALPTHYNTSKIAKGFGDAVIHFLVSEHGLSTKIHVSLGAIVGVSYIFMLLFNIHARVWHRTIAPIATLSSLGLMMSNVYAMYVRPGGMAPVGFASFATNTIATVLATAAIAVGLYAKSIPNYVLHRRAMIIAAGAIFANPAERFVIAVVSHIPGLIPTSYDTWPAFRDGPWDVALWVGFALALGTAALYSSGMLGEGDAAAAKATLAACSSAKKN